MAMNYPATLLQVATLYLRILDHLAMYQLALDQMGLDQVVASRKVYVKTYARHV